MILRGTRGSRDDVARLTFSWRTLSILIAGRG
jgi:hypothetical protein